MPYILPTPEPRRRWYNDYGETQGIAANVLLKALLAQAGAGGGPFAPKNIPNPGYGQTGTLQFPGGASTMTNPQEMAQIQRMGGVPTTQGTLSSYTATPPSPYATKPLLNAAQFQGLLANQQYQKNQQSLDPNSPVNQFLLGQARSNNAAAQPQTQTTPDLVKYLAQKALEGDTEADAHLKALGF